MTTLHRYDPTTCRDCDDGVTHEQDDHGQLLPNPLSVLPASPRTEVTREPIQGKTARGVVLDDYDGDYVDPGK